MEKIFALVIGMALVWLIWRKLVLPTILLKTRNDLFDLRDLLRDEFLKANLTLDDKAYLAVRMSINSRLRFIEDLTYWKMIYFTIWAKSNDETIKKISHRLDVKFRTTNGELNKCISRIRRDANSIVLTYSIFTSFFALSTAFIIASFITCIKVLQTISVSILASLRLLKEPYQVAKYIFRKINKILCNPSAIFDLFSQESFRSFVAKSFVYKQRAGLVEDISAPYGYGYRFA